MNIFKIIDMSISKKLTVDNLRLSVLISLLSFIGSFSSIFIFLIFLFIFCDEKISFIESVCSLIFVTGIVFILKFTVKRKRNTSEINKIKQKIDPYSFPSGHISRIFAAVSPFYNLLPVVISIFILGFFVSIARICKGYHYFSDCLVGVFTGIISSVLAKIVLKTILTIIC
ncbi:MAG: phosphatase PAP2 family protein [Spirochaetales bacterium]|nr:phosphatase PAP2 family protein [Spirochaetales bacterium]